jgi:flagellum-specific peptidoglycan hydrolase FlgJ
MKEPINDEAINGKQYLIIIILLLLPFLMFAQTKTEVYNYLIEIGCKHPDIVTAQSRLETGNYTSFSCTNRKNLFGLRYNHKYLIFNTWKESCDAYMTKIQYKYVSGDYYEFLERLGYATDKEYINKLKRFKRG